MKHSCRHNGFTLIELSIVLVIVGLIVGGILAGRDLIGTSQVHATITQLQKYQSAVNTFYAKYGSLPGDLNSATASRFGFAPRDVYRGSGDANGILESGNSFGYKGVAQGYGETAMLWSDLTYANGMKINLIEGNFSQSDIVAGPPAIFQTQPWLMIPAAKIGGSNYISVYSPGYCCGWVNTDPRNYYALSSFISLSGGDMTAGPGISVKTAYDVDKKLDDGLPQTGSVTATYGGVNGVWTSPNAPTASSATCFDTTSKTYSITQNNGAGVNCGLSFRFQ